MLTAGEHRALEQVKEAGPLGLTVERHWESRTQIALASNGFLDMERKCAAHSTFTLTDKGRLALANPKDKEG